jgi:hypothetical protein
MSVRNSAICSSKDYGVLPTGLLMGLAGGLAEIVVVWLYSALTGGDATIVARHVASTMGLKGAPATTGMAIHMGLALVLGILLSATLKIFVDRSAPDRLTFPLVVGSLAVVWAINFFMVLPAVSPGFVHLLPYVVTLASKLAFGFAAAVTFKLLPVSDPIEEIFGHNAAQTAV